MGKGVWIQISALGTLVAGLAYAWLIEPARVEVTHHRVESSAKSEPQIRLVQLSDLHLQSIGRREHAVAREVQTLKPDMLILSGDVIDNAGKLSVLEAFLPLLGSGEKVAILGNWEHWSRVDLNYLRGLYSRHGVRLLVNEHATYRFGDRTVQINGLDDFTGGRPQVNAAESSQSGSVNLIIQHSPGWFRTP
jgi:predicted MPP superfamily phosphohydrolase